MTKRLFALLAGAVTGSLLGVASPVHAASVLMLTPSVFSVAIVGTANFNATCSSSGTPLSKTAALIRPEFQSKSQAILSGRVSALEQMTRQQQGFAVPAQAMTTANPTLTSLRDSMCQGFAQPFVEKSSVGSRRPEIAINPDDFLDSKRLLIRKTPFDSSWNRVRRSNLSRSYAASLLGRVGGSNSLDKLSMVNAWTNRNVRYVEDKMEFGKADYWSDARSTLRRRAGDCEDIAIAKMQLLAALGFERSHMYLTITRDLVRNADHALLIVHAEGRNWLLDDSTDTLLDASASFDYRPIMSFSQNQAWLHGYSSLAANVR